MMMRTIFELVVFLAIVIADAFGFVPITQTIFLLPFIWISLRSQGQRWAEIGFKIPKNFGKYVLQGSVFGIGLELVAVYGTTPLISSLFGVEPDYSAFDDVQGNLVVLLFYVALSWALGAFGEEICFRGFLINRLIVLTGDKRAGWVIALVVSSTLFGYGHTEQGISGWVQEGLSGLWLGILFLAYGRNLTVPIVSHGVSNTLAFVLMYFGKYPGMG